MRNLKTSAWREFKKQPTVVHRIAYKKANAIFKRECKAAKRISFTKFTESINPQTSVKFLWGKVNKLYGKATPLHVRVLETEEGGTVTDPHNIAQSFASTWSEQSKDSNFASSFISNKSNINLSRSYIVDSIANFLEDPITLIEFDSALNTAKGKSAGFDKISYSMLKHLPYGIKQRYIQLYNEIFQIGHIPQEWKTATVLPILKPGKPKTEVNGYRPISLLLCPAKILEKIVAKRLTWFLSKRKLISPHQMAFKSGKSTLDALLHIDNQIAQSISRRHHISILSVDFERAYDRIGKHAILNQLMEWKVGPKLLRYIHSFLSNRKFRIRINGIYTKTYPLENGIPQGSPLSVILFQIGTEHINKIMLGYPCFNYCIYADDFYLLAKIKSEEEFKNRLRALFQEILDWCHYSGSQISFPKTKLLHVCMKTSCRLSDLVIDNKRIEYVKSLKILGLVFNNKYTWSAHIEALRISLFNRLNLIKCLTSYHSSAHPNSVINITKALVLSKVDYGLAIYGNTSERQLNKLKGVYNTAARHSIGAFRITPIKNIYAETGIPDIISRYEEITSKQIPKVILYTDKQLVTNINQLATRKRDLRFPPAICAIIENQYKIGINIRAYKLYSPQKPPWHFSTNSIVTDLMQLPKSTTNPQVFITTFKEVVSKFRLQNWNLIYTDGSKTEHATSFSIISSDLRLEKLFRLDENSSIFTAETQALLEAVNTCKVIQGKHLICSDSLSAIKALLNIQHKNETIQKIRNALIQYPTKIRIMWIPSHVGIRGNELADEAAKFATTAPIITQKTINKNDIIRSVKYHYSQINRDKWSRYIDGYKSFNEEGLAIKYPYNFSRNELIKYTRLRLCHTRLTLSEERKKKKETEEKMI